MEKSGINEATSHTDILGKIIVSRENSKYRNKLMRSSSLVKGNTKYVFD